MRAVAAALLLLAAAPASALEVSPLTGRVVDLAGVLSPATEAALESRLTAHEDSTSNQVVVLTIPDLEGEVLEPYATRVFRAWGLGQAGRDNGVLLLVAVRDRGVRIEVGYGLEGDLTDATAGSIIRSEIVPRFKAGDFDAGVLGGTEAVLQSLAGTYAPRPAGSADGRVTVWGALSGALAFWLAAVLLSVLTFALGKAPGCLGRSGASIVTLFAMMAMLAGFGQLVQNGWAALLFFVFVIGSIAAVVRYSWWLDDHPVHGPRRRRERAEREASQKARNQAFRAARKRGDKQVVFEGRTIAVPPVSRGSSFGSSSSGSSFSGGGGSSGGGGASGSW